MFKLTRKRRVEMIGAKGIVSAAYFGKPDWKRQALDPRPAWVTGFGVIRRGFTESLGYDDGVVFCQLETIKVIKVRFWPTEKEVSIPLDAITLDPTASPYPTMAQYAKRDREFYKGNLEQYPRSEKGRFISSLDK